MIKNISYVDEHRSVQNPLKKIVPYGNKIIAIIYSFKWNFPIDKYTNAKSFEKFYSRKEGF